MRVKCRREKFPSISAIFGEISVRGVISAVFWKNRSQLEYFEEKSSDYFADFLKKLVPCTYCWSDGSQLPRVDLTVQIWSELQRSFYVHLMVQIEVGCDPTARIEPQRLCDDPMVRFRSNGQFCFPTVKWDSNSFFGPIFFYK